MIPDPSRETPLLPAHSICASCCERRERYNAACAWLHRKFIQELAQQQDDCKGNSHSRIARIQVTVRPPSGMRCIFLLFWLLPQLMRKLLMRGAPHGVTGFLQRRRSSSSSGSSSLRRRLILLLLVHASTPARCYEMLNPPEDSRSYSSTWRDDAPGTRHALSMLNSTQAWSAGSNTAGSEYVTIDAGVELTVAAVATQGRHLHHEQRVSAYAVATSTDGSR